MPRPLFPPVFDMPDISDLTATVARDPLAPVLALFVLGGLATHFLFRNYPVGRAIVRVVFLVFLTIAFVRAGIVPYQPLQSTGTPLLDVVHGGLEDCVVAVGGLVSGRLSARLCHRRAPAAREQAAAGPDRRPASISPPSSPIVSYVFDLPIQGLLATSGVVAVILGLALQSTLGDVFSGIVLNFSRPYLPGDWITIDGGTEGRVIEMNWRATHVLTGKRDLAIVPNSTIAKSKIVNVSSPSGIHGVTVTLHLDPQDAALDRERDHQGRDAQLPADPGGARPERHRQIDHGDVDAIRRDLLRRRAGLFDECPEPVVRSDLPPPRRGRRSNWRRRKANRSRRAQPKAREWRNPWSNGSSASSPSSPR